MSNYWLLALTKYLRLGFKRICTLEEVADAYPLLDIVDHDNRKKIVSDTDIVNNIYVPHFNKWDFVQTEQLEFDDDVNLGYTLQATQGYQEKDFPRIEGSFPSYNHLY